MEVGDADGFGRYGAVDEDAGGLLCHECGERFAHLGLHAYRAHGMTAAAYRSAHGLGRRGLVARSTGLTIAENARAQLSRNPNFVLRRDPVKATAARLEAGSVISPEGLEALRQANAVRRGQHRLGTVVTCEWCGAQFCPLRGAKRRRFCSRTCASTHNRRVR